MYAKELAPSLRLFISLLSFAFVMHYHFRFQAHQILLFVAWTRQESLAWCHRSSPCFGRVCLTGLLDHSGSFHRLFSPARFGFSSPDTHRPVFGSVARTPRW